MAAEHAAGADHERDVAKIGAPLHEVRALAGEIDGAEDSAMTPERVGHAGGRQRPVDAVLVRAVRQIIRLPLAPGTGVPKLLGRVS